MELSPGTMEVTIISEMSVAEALAKYPEMRDKILAAKWPESRQDELGRILGSQVKFCGCGSNRKWVAMRLLLENAQTHTRAFYDEDNDPDPVFWEFAANCLDGMGLIDHGTGIGYPFLTDDGNLLLEFLRDYPDCSWPEWADGLI